MSSGKVRVPWSELLIVAIFIALGSINYPLILRYEWHKILHLVGVIMFLGNITVSACWVYLAQRSNGTAFIAFAIRSVNTMDAWFTRPGVFLVVLSGLTLSDHWGGPYGKSWNIMGMVLLVLSGLIWFSMLVPCQNKILKHIGDADGSASNGTLSLELRSMLGKWFTWGAMATVLPILALIVMMIKPDMW